MERRKPIQRKTPLKRAPFAPKPKTTSSIKWDADGMCKHGARRGDCRKCISSRNKRFGQAVQREMHQALGGTGFTPHHEESGRGYTVQYEDGWHPEPAGVRLPTVEVTYRPKEVKVHPEAKGGDQIPKALEKFLGTDWYRRALSQSQRSLPVGSGAKPAVWCHLPGGKKVLIIDYGGGK